MFCFLFVLVSDIDLSELGYVCIIV